MAKDIKITAHVRQGTGSAEVGRLRRAGSLPCVVYGDAGENTSILIDTHEFGQMLRHHTGENLIADLNVEGVGTRKVMIKEIQRDPVSDELLHVDFSDISMTRKMKVSITVELFGEAEGVQAGGVLEHLLREVEVECLPGDLVEMLEVDVSALNIGDHLSVGDMNWDPVLTILTAPNIALCAVAAPRVEEEPDEEEVEEGAEPEVVGKEGETDGEGEEQEKTEA